MKPSHVLPGESVGASLCRPSEPPAEVRERVGGQHGEQHRERRQAAFVRAARAGGRCARGRSRSRPRRAPSRRSRRSPALASSRTRSARTRRRSIARNPPRIQTTPPCSAPRSASKTADVHRRCERTQRARHRDELVHRDHPGDRDAALKSHQPPAQTAPSTTGRPMSATRTRETRVAHLSAESTAAARIVLDCGAKFCRPEVRPEGVDE